eukprot:TRINITY_DN2929_c2_g1_i1.p1 TRINITY_DN2929_c2_g1~~TRINITY_DN2929_c2_g1_i1.p1  ORF type:complete len:233 (+),score=38.67 TRINITY_DN2929_c2_g1_i1:101-799(+)
MAKGKQKNSRSVIVSSLWNFFGAVVIIVCAATIHNLYQFLHDTGYSLDSSSQKTGIRYLVWDLALAMAVMFIHQGQIFHVFRENYLPNFPYFKSAHTFSILVAIEVAIYAWVRTNGIVIYNLSSSSSLSFFCYWINVAGWLIIITHLIISSHFLNGQFGIISTENAAPSPEFTQVLQHAEHPIFVGVLLAFWFIPVLTFDRFLLNLSVCVYSVLLNKFKESDADYISNFLDL